MRARWYIVGVHWLAHIVLYFMGIHFVLDFTSLFHSSPFVSSHSFPLWRSHHAALKGFDIVMSLSAVVVAFRAARRCVVSLRATTTMVFENVMILPRRSRDLHGQDEPIRFFTV